MCVKEIPSLRNLQGDKEAPRRKVLLLLDLGAHFLAGVPLPGRADPTAVELLRSGDELHVAACSVRSLELAPLLLVDLALVLVRVLRWR